MRCSNCGTESAPAAAFCSSCGQPLTAPEERHDADTPPPPENEAAGRAAGGLTAAGASANLRKARSTATRARRFLGIRLPGGSASGVRRARSAAMKARRFQRMGSAGGAAGAGLSGVVPSKFRSVLRLGSAGGRRGSSAPRAPFSARRVWRQVRRATRWVFGLVFIVGSILTIWSNIDRWNIPVLRDLDIPSVSEVFGGDASPADETIVTADAPAASDPPAGEAIVTPGSLQGTIEAVEVSTGGSSAQLAFDGDRATGWRACDGCEDPFGVGASITVIFRQPVTITEVAILNGIEEAGDGLLPVLEVEMESDGDALFPLQFDDSVQLYRFADPRLEHTTTQIRFTIKSVSRVDEAVGTTALGEIELVGTVAEASPG